MNGALAGKVALVTGAGQGIGRAIAKRFAAEGAEVVVATLSAPPGEQTVREIEESGGKARLELVDIGERDAVFALVDRIRDQEGALDILVHNAGVWPFAQIGDLSEDDLERTMAVNLKACFWLVQAALPLIEASSSGRILFTSSVSGNHAYAVGLAHYSASKAGLNGLVRNLALELAPRGITVNAVEPGFIVTEKLSAPEMADFVNGSIARIPMKRGGAPADIAEAMLFFASPAAGYVTGQALVVDGGVTLTSALHIEAISA
ncbi:SDR family NAD(P)-dependent oxidoreductase [Sphingosinicella terrae]|jgi:3-oxoacyl-[acyl-carrier protein] reductase|uniref:SDR family NAD(P)-dependent oxidoreductase n=1 Tax=Sphingosinicella terrae TaxID=2172047 RepID=UPI000E0D3E63|nr:SDR family oxidoreductase [Sphingosinicella terrae]